MENAQDLQEFMEALTIDISTTEKKSAAAAHKKWVPKQKGILLYTDGSRKKTNSSGWHITVNGKTIHEGHCNIGTNTDIQDAEIHAIREGINLLQNMEPTPSHITICADNQ